MTYLSILPFVILFLGVACSAFALKYRKKSISFACLSEAMKEHISALDRVLGDERVPQEDKDRLCLFSDFACESETAGEFLKFVRKTLGEPDSERIPRYFDGNIELFSQHFNAVRTGILVASFVATGSSTEGIYLTDLLLANPVPEEQIVYRFDFKRKRFPSMGLQTS